MALTQMQRTDAMAHRDPIHAARALHRALVYREDDTVALLKRHDCRA